MEYRRIQQVWFLILLGAVTVAFLWLTLDFIQPVFWAAVLAVIFNPLQRQLENLFGGRRTQAALAGTILILVVVFVPLILVGIAVSQEALGLYDRAGADDVVELIQQTALTAYRALKLRDYGRIDLRLAQNGRVYVIEANPNPWLDPAAEFAMAAKESGISYRDVIERIVNEAMKR